jgi:hypothetical protein
MERLRESRRCEDGIFLILWAVLAVGLFGMVAIVIDLGALRADRREQRAAADAAATAAAHVMVKDGGLNACAVAWQYATTNLAVPPGSPPCGSFPACTGADWSVTGTSGPYTITITHPVLDGDPLLDADAVGPDFAVNLHADADGVACDRVGIQISSSRTPIFARVLGYNSNRTSAHSVARIAPGGPGDEPASLVLLERRECRAVRTDGTNTRLIVAAANGAAGRIQVDSAGDTSCAGGRKVVEGTAGSSGPSILAQHLRDPSGTTILKDARIQIFAKLLGSSNDHTPWPTTVGEPNPIGFRQVGRTPIDSRYLDNVRALETEATAAVTSSSSPFGATVSFVNVTDPAPTGLGLGCTIDTPTPITTGTRFWFNCPGGLTVRNLTITAPNAELVINGPLSTTSTGFYVHDARKFWVRGKTTGNDRGIDLGAPFVVNNANLATCANRFTADRTAVGTMFLKEGTLETSSPSARVQWCQMFLYLRGDASATATSALPSAVTAPPALPPPPGNYGSNGSIGVTGGAAIDWTAPNVLDVLPTPIDLTVHKFEDFALWTEAHEQSNLNGGGGLTLGGIYFLPNADPFRITGNSGQNIQVDAQFYVRKLEIRGGSILRMIPNPSNQVPIPTSVVALIR